MAAESMLTFVMSNSPDEWENVSVYSESFHLFTLSRYGREYQKVERLLPGGVSITQIQRVQNPFQYGRYMLRREMMPTAHEFNVFHGVHKDDLTIALKFNCDYRRYTKKREAIFERNNHPLFFNSFSELRATTKYPLDDLRVLVLSVLDMNPKSQCDYYIEYVLRCKL